jgi:ribosomal protein S24E
MKLDLTKKEIKLIEKALMNRKVGKDEEKTREKIYEKIENAENIEKLSFLIKK